jgi:hypothetical protein
MSDAIDPNIDPNTILYVDACVKRWEPLVKSMAKERQGFTSYLCERESKYLQSIYDPMTPDERMKHGADLKWVFPILRRTCERIALGETEFDRLFQAAEAVVDEMSEPVWCVWGMRDHGPPEEVKTNVLPLLVERAHAGLLDYEKITGGS